MSLADRRERLRATVGDGRLPLLVPLVAFDLLVFVVPFGLLLRISLTERVTAQAYGRGTWSLDGYDYVAATATLREAFLFTLGFAVVVTAVSVAVSLVYAYAVWRSSGSVRVLLLVGVLVSMFTAIVVKLFAAVLVFSPAGVVNEALTATGLMGEPLLLVNNGIGAAVGQLYIVVPYSILAVYSVLSTVDESLVEAARDLGAGRVRAFREVVIPHATPGILVAAVISFTWSVGSFAAPTLLGSGNERTAGMAVSDLLLQRFDWAAAAALAVTMTVTVFGALVVGRVLVGRLGVNADG